MSNFRLLFKSIIKHISELSYNLFISSVMEKEYLDKLRFELAETNLRRILYWAVFACVQEIIIIVFNINKGEHNKYGSWLRTSAIFVIVFNLLMIALLLYIQTSRKQDIKVMENMNRVYWAAFSLLMLNFIMMDILAEGSYLNYFLLLIMLSICAILNFKEWLALTGSAVFIITTLIVVLPLDKMHIYYIITLFFGGALFNRILYTSFVKAFRNEYILKRDNLVLHEQCITDPLTGLLNRRGFEIKSKELWERCKQNGEFITAVFIDVDLFKRYNDYYGHQRGDDCLIKIACCIDNAARNGNNVLSRYGGEEFLLLLDGITGEEAVVLAKSIKDSVEHLRILSPTNPISEYLTVSIGLSITIPSDGTDIEELLRQTDNYLYAAKNNGRNMLMHNI